MGNPARYGLDNPPRTEYARHGIREHGSGVRMRTRQEIDRAAQEENDEPMSDDHDNSPAPYKRPAKKYTCVLWMRLPKLYWQDTELKSEFGPWCKGGQYESDKAGEQALERYGKSHVYSNIGGQFKLLPTGVNPNEESP